jgi:hypothetical protein
MTFKQLGSIRAVYAGSVDEATVSNRGSATGWPQLSQSAFSIVGVGIIEPRF